MPTYFDVRCPITGLPLKNASRSDLEIIWKDEEMPPMLEKNLERVPSHPWYQELIALCSDGTMTRDIRFNGDSENYGRIHGIDCEDIYLFGEDGDDNFDPSYWLGRNKTQPDHYTLVTSLAVYTYFKALGFSGADIVKLTCLYYGCMTATKSEQCAPGMIVLKRMSIKVAHQISFEFLKEFINRGYIKILEAPSRIWFHKILKKIGGCHGSKARACLQKLHKQIAAKQM